MIPDELKAYDYRENLITDQDNSILIQKAWRDRFSGTSHWDAGYGGQAYLSRRNSEDALTWNVFRALQLAGEQGLVLMSKILQVSSVGTILFWGCDVEQRGEEQQLLNILIRTIDGKHRGTVTEPDLVIITDQEVAFVECKLNQPGRTSPWRTSSEGSANRFATYVELFPELAGLRDWREAYQMIRQYVYAKSLGKQLGRKPQVTPLINGDHRAILSRYYVNLRDKLPDEAKVFQDFVTWQDIAKDVAASGLPHNNIIVLKMEEALAAAS